MENGCQKEIEREPVQKCLWLYQMRFDLNDGFQWLLPKNYTHSIIYELFCL
jgi:hypothetical protein